MTVTIAAEEAQVRADLTHDHRRKIPALTGIRGYAALWVVLYHCVNNGWYRLYTVMPISDDLFGLLSGYLGVDLFFILSGFVLTKTYVTSTRRMRLCGCRDFAIGRVFRIMPLNWTILLLFAAVSPLMNGQWLSNDAHDVRNLILSAFLVQSWVGLPTTWNAPGWSLSAEWLTYFGFPVLAIVQGRIRKSWMAWAMAVMALLMLALLYHHLRFTSLSQTRHFGLARCVCEFAAGSALCRAVQIRPSGEKEGNAFLVAGLLLLLPALVSQRFDLLALPAFSSLVLASNSPSRLADAIFGNRVTHFLGEISFSIYLLHWLLLELVFRFAPDTRSLIVWLVILPFAVIPLAWATWRWIEVPGQAVGRAIVKRLRERDRQPAR